MIRALDLVATFVAVSASSSLAWAQGAPAPETGGTSAQALRAARLTWMRCPGADEFVSEPLARFRVFVNPREAAAIEPDELLVVESNARDNALSKPRARHRRAAGALSNGGGFSLAGGDHPDGTGIATKGGHAVVAVDASLSMWRRDRKGPSSWERIIAKFRSEFADAPDAKVAVLPFSCAHPRAEHVARLQYRSGRAALADFSERDSKASFREDWGPRLFSGVELDIGRPRDTQLFATVVEVLEGMVRDDAPGPRSFMLFTDGVDDVARCPNRRARTCAEVAEAVDAACDADIDVRLFVDNRIRCPKGRPCPSLDSCLRRHYQARDTSLSCDADGASSTCPTLCTPESSSDGLAATSSPVIDSIRAPAGYFDVFVKPFARAEDLETAEFELLYQKKAFARTGGVGSIPFSAALTRPAVENAGVVARLCGGTVQQRRVPGFFVYPVLLFGTLAGLIVRKAGAARV